MYDAILVTAHHNYNNQDNNVFSEDLSPFEEMALIVPLGIIHIAQHLYDSGFKVRVVHIPQEKYLLEHRDQQPVSIEDILRKYPAHVCGIQAHWYQYAEGAIHISKLYKKLFPESRVFLGGYTATIFWNEFLTNSVEIDGIVLGEGEKSFAQIVEKVLLSQDCDLGDLNGIGFRDNTGKLICKMPQKDCILSLEDVPVIRPDAPPFENLIWQRYHSINISRGICPERCSYCLGNNSSVNSRAYQTLKIEKILEQLEVYERCGIKEIFLGENHFLNSSYMEELVENIIREDFNLTFRLETHPVLFENERLLKRMIQGKFFRYSMGCESGSNSVLKRIGRNSSAQQILNSVRSIADHGGIVLTSWISNLPGESKDEWRETQELLKEVVKVGGFVYWIGNLVVFPGTMLYRKHKEFDIKILHTTLNDWIEWASISKYYVDFSEVTREPIVYLTHLNNNSSPEEMVDRFYLNRKFARSLAPEMKLNLDKRFSGLPVSLREITNRAIEWYESVGWKLLVF